MKQIPASYRCLKPLPRERSGHPWKRFFTQTDWMMRTREQVFLRQSADKVKDLGHRQKMNHALKQSDDAFEKGKALFSNLELARDWAHAIKREAIEHLDTYLCEFERNFTQ